MNRYSDQKDRTAQRSPSGGGSGDMRLAWVGCGCLAVRKPGAVVKGRVLWKCAACAAKGKA